MIVIIIIKLFFNIHKMSTQSNLLGIPPFYHFNLKECPNCSGNSPKYTFGSAIITIVIGALAFITALAWNDLAKSAFERTGQTETQIIESKLSYAYLATAIAIVVGFLLMYYIEGEKW